MASWRKFGFLSFPAMCADKITQLAGEESAAHAKLAQLHEGESRKE